MNSHSFSRKWLIIQSVIGINWFIVLLAFPYHLLIYYITAFWIFFAFIALVINGGGIGTVADKVTLIRVILMAFTCVHSASFSNQNPNHVPIILCALFLLMDKLDGCCAEKWGGSDAGAVYDMESDQFSVVVLSMLGYLQAGLPFFILFFPLIRYVYVLFSEAVGIPSNDPKPVRGNNTRGKTIFLVIAAILFFNLIPSVSMPIKISLTAMALILLIWSFSADFIFLYRNVVKRA